VIKLCFDSPLFVRTGGCAHTLKRGASNQKKIVSSTVSACIAPRDRIDGKHTYGYE